MERGWVKLWRRMVDSAVFANSDLLKLWILCLLKANHDDAWVEITGVVEPVRVLRGQFITGRFALHADFYQTKRKNNKSPSTVWRWLESLKSMRKVNIRTNSRFTLVTVPNWALYQDVAQRREQRNGAEMNSRCTAGEQPVHTNKNVQNEKKDKKNEPARETFPDSDTEPRPALLPECEQLAMTCYGSVPIVLSDWFGQYEHEWIPEAMKLTADNGKRSWQYTRAILERWRVDGKEEQQQGVDFDYTPIV